jgi:anaerobic selenocysteine-containing dehydrogenase
MNCGVLVELENGRPAQLHGDVANPVYHGYSCIKGRELPAYHSLPSRLLHSQKRRDGGGFAPIGSEQAITEIAERLARILSEHGPRAVALFVGTFGGINVPASSFATAFLEAIESPMMFTPLTIDQPANVVAPTLHGPWLAGLPTPEECDVILLVGHNALVSQSGGLGPNPARQRAEMMKLGQKLIVIDPRVSESARKADLHLQARPGEDPTILAALIRVILREGLYDREFVDAEAVKLDELRAAVEPFTPEYAAARADVPAEDLVRAARMIAAAKKCGVKVGTGPNMAGRSNLSSYLAQLLITLTGSWRRAGERLPNPGVLVRRGPPIAGTKGPQPAWGFGEKLRVRGLTDTAAGMPTAVLADEILEPGDGQVRALIVVGGNPMLAWPDQLKVQKAMQALDLLVCVDPHMSATAKLADYVIAPKLPLEMPSSSLFYEFVGASGLIGLGWGYSQPYAQYTPALVEPPAGADVIEDWELFYGLCQRLGKPLTITPSFSVLDAEQAAALATPLDMTRKPTPDDILELVTNGSPVPLAKVKATARQGRLFDVPEQHAQPRPDDWTGRLDLGNPVMLAELDEVAAEDYGGDHASSSFRLLCRRMNDSYNSSWHEDERLGRYHRANPAFMNPLDMAAIGVKAGDVIEIISRRASILGVVEAAPEIRRACISMPHCWGTNPDEPDAPRTHGASTSRIVAGDEDLDPYTAMPRMSALPIEVRPWRGTTAGIANI